jgi:phage shock protein PspC (stress-responsive transcriptional regulator)
MKKIININFHSRVIPIEETAYEILQQYIDSLRRYFAHEEGRDEIISDIENRFSELFADKLKKGVPCITDDDVNSIITSMGRPEEFEAEESAGATAGSGSQAGGNTATGANPGGSSQQQGSGQGQYETSEARRLYRAGNDKILGGVCAGLANFLRLDPAIVRIIFVLITFTWGFGFLLYILLWIILPTRSLPVNARKRLYRNSDDRVIGGVASGLAAYFHIEVWIPRLIFALPLILGVVTSIIRSAWWFHFHFSGPVFFTGGFGGTLFITYIVLWVVLPEAVSASEKLEMRGEKVDLESIKNTVKSDLETFKGRAKEMGSEMQERFQQVGQQVRQGTQTFTSEAGPVIRRSSNGIGHAIGVLFKAFFLFIAGLIAFGLILGLISLAFAGNGVLDLKGYILSGFWQNFLAWSSFILFLVTPVVALLTWLIRRITGIRSRTHYLGYMFATLWILGLISVITLVGLVMNNFRSRQHIEDEVSLTQPSTGRMVIKAMQPAGRIFDTDWWFAGDWRHHGPFYNLNDDSLLLTTIRVNVLKSEDAEYHVRVLRFSRSDNSRTAMALAQQIVFPVRQSDSIFSLPAGFTINIEQKFRNQQVLVAISVPVGKKIMLDKSVKNYEWFSISANSRHIRWSNNGNDEDNWEDATDLENAYSWNTNVEYIMTSDGLSRADRAEIDRKERPEKAERPEQPERKEQDENGNKKSQHDTNNDGYRYKGPAKPARKSGSDTPVIKSTTMLSVPYSSQFVLLSTLVNPL